MKTIYFLLTILIKKCINYIFINQILVICFFKYRFIHQTRIVDDTKRSKNIAKNLIAGSLEVRK